MVKCAASWRQEAPAVAATTDMTLVNWCAAPVPMFHRRRCAPNTVQTSSSTNAATAAR